jgi:nucleotide-binding universal stress UspA family protein
VKEIAMWQRILVPTDSSAFSEQAMPFAAALAQAQGAELLLVQVAPFPHLPLQVDEVNLASAEVYDEVFEDTKATAQTSLLARAEQLRATGLAVRTILAQGSPAAALLDVERGEQPDAVVMATHGHTGLTRLALGSVAERMVREGTCPVLLVRQGETPTAQLHRALVLLDGSGVAEQALSLVQILAGHPIRTIQLFRVVADPDDRGAAHTYLEGVAAQLAPTGLACELVVEVGEPSHLISRAATAADLVILCTHGRSGFDRLRHGSVAEHIIRQVDRPVFLVRAPA